MEKEIKHRFGNIEICLTDEKVEVYDMPNRYIKYSFSNETTEYAFLHYNATGLSLLINEDLPEEERGKNLEFMAYVLFFTRSVLTNADIARDFYKMYGDKMLNGELKEDDPDALAEMKTEYIANEVLENEKGEMVADIEIRLHDVLLKMYYSKFKRDEYQVEFDDLPREVTMNFTDNEDFAVFRLEVTVNELLSFLKK